MENQAICSLCDEMPESRLRYWITGIGLYFLFLGGIPYEWDTCRKCRSRRNFRIAGQHCR
jgi:hypothetical protein